MEQVLSDLCSYVMLLMYLSVAQIDADDEVVVMLQKHVVVDYLEQKVYVFFWFFVSRLAFFLFRFVN